MGMECQSEGPIMQHIVHSVGQPIIERKVFHSIYIYIYLGCNWHQWCPWWCNGVSRVYIDGEPEGSGGGAGNNQNSTVTRNVPLSL